VENTKWANAPEKFAKYRSRGLVSVRVKRIVQLPNQQPVNIDDETFTFARDVGLVKYVRGGPIADEVVFTDEIVDATDSTDDPTTESKPEGSAIGNAKQEERRLSEPVKSQRAQTPYEEGYEDGLRVAQSHCSQYRRSVSENPPDRDRARNERQKNDFVRVMRKQLKTYEDLHQFKVKNAGLPEDVQRTKGQLDSYRKTIGELGIR
jgi:hypothetical protein